MGIKHYIEEHIEKFTTAKALNSLEILADYIDTNTNKSKVLKRKIIGVLNDCHYDRETALKDVSKMFYETDDGNKYAPYWSLEEVSSIYDNIKKNYDILSIYNVYDFYVTLNMIKSDNYELYKKRFNGYSNKQLDELFVEDAINWLNDKDNPFGDSKIWGYINSQYK